VVFRRRIPLLEKSIENSKKNVIIYGATSHMGQITANIFIKYGYSVILIDANLQKL
jgi:short-subunit dehydrogenase